MRKGQRSGIWRDYFYKTWAKSRTSTKAHRKVPNTPTPCNFEVRITDIIIIKFSEEIIMSKVIMLYSLECYLTPYSFLCCPSLAVDIGQPTEEQMRSLLYVSYSERVDLQRTAALCFAEISDRSKLWWFLHLALMEVQSNVTYPTTSGIRHVG